MQKRALCAALCLALFVVFGGQAGAAESAVNIMVDGVVLETEVITQTHAQNTYVSYWPIIQAVYPDAVATWEDNSAVIRAEGLTLRIRPNALYLEANGRYLYVPGGMVIQGPIILVPARTLAQAIGATTWWDETTNSVKFQSGSGPIASGESTYNPEDVYWLSRIISAESGNQALTGKIAVGDVIMNRVADPRFPKTVRDVIFQTNQFSPVGNGSIDREPTAESVVAAKLVLEGANTAQDSLYFVNPNLSPNSWAARNRTHVATIGAHAFFE